VTFTSATAGTVIGNATTTFTLHGVTLTRSTGDAKSGDSGPATKVFEDEYITITPTASNKAGDPHTFTATVYLNAGDGTGFHVAPNGTAVTVTLTASNGASISPISPSPTSTTATTATYNLTTSGGNGQVAVTFTSPTAGTVMGQATTTLSLSGGGSITRTTGDSYSTTGGADSPNANKYFITLTTQALPSDQVTATATSSGISLLLTDRADLEGAFNPTGTITFRLYNSATRSSIPTWST